MFTSTITPLTETDAINVMLDAIGESPVVTLDDQALDESGQALRLLRAESRSFQGQGWGFNTDLSLPMPLDQDGTIPVAFNVAGFTPTGPWRGSKVVIRGQRLYDRQQNSYIFTGRPPMYGDVIWLFDFCDMPEAARYYVMVRAARKFQDNKLGDQELNSFEERDELAAYAQFLTRENEDDDYNVIRDSGIRASRYTSYADGWDPIAKRTPPAPTATTTTPSTLTAADLAVILAALPTTLPATSGVLWNNNGVIELS